MDLVEHDVPRLDWWGRFFAGQIQELLGHSGIRVSERSTKPRRPALRRAALKATRLMGVELPSSSPSS